jgi:hypothetical protein
MQKNKILILILSTNDKAYDTFKKSITDTWVSNAQKYFTIIFYEGDNIDNKLDGNILKLNCNDSTLNTGKKLLHALNFIQKSKIEYTHIYRTNLSSFLYIDDFINYCNLLPHTFYGGLKAQYLNFNFFNRLPSIFQNLLKKIPFITINYAAGSGFFLSKDLVLKIVNSNKINYFYLDDVMIGNILRNHTIINIPRYDIINQNNSTKNSNAFHVRIKTTNRLEDALLMYDLNKFKCLNDYLTQ